MSYGLSCIASDIPANRNVPLPDNRFFLAGNATLMTAKIKEYIDKAWNDDDQKRQINLIDDKYNWKKIACDTLMVYKRVVYKNR